MFYLKRIRSVPGNNVRPKKRRNQTLFKSCERKKKRKTNLLEAQP